MLTVVMHNDKNLSIATTSVLHQYDNNSDLIKCILPCTYDNLCLKDATVIMIFKDINGNGGQLELTISDEKYDKDHHQFYNRINSDITSYVGKFTIWLKVIDYENNFSFETGETSFSIIPSKALPTSQNNQLKQNSYFDQWLIKMTQIRNETLKIQRDTINLTNTSRLETEKLKQEVAFLKGGGINVN